MKKVKCVRNNNKYVTFGKKKIHLRKKTGTREQNIIKRVPNQYILKSDEKNPLSFLPTRFSPPITDFTREED